MSGGVDFLNGVALDYVVQSGDVAHVAKYVDHKESINGDPLGTEVLCRETESLMLDINKKRSTARLAVCFG
jgi:hypothetical protein